MAGERFLPNLSPRARRWPRRAGIGLGGMVAIALVLLSFVYYQPRWLVDRVSRYVPDVIFRVPTHEPIVALTFDDGPDPAITPQILAILKRANVPATFFLHGDAVREYPELAKEIREQGHDFGNHLWVESAELPMRADTFQLALANTQEVLPPNVAPALHRPTGVFIRPAEERICDAAGYKIVLGSAYGGDGQGAPGAFVSWALTEMAEPGGILVLHAGAGRARTVELLPDLINGLRKKGLGFVTVHELLKRAPPVAP